MMQERDAASGGSSPVVQGGFGPSPGKVTGCDLGNLTGLCLPFASDPFYRLRPPLSRQAMTLSLELAAMTYHLELEGWMAAGWTDISIQIDNTLQSGVTRGESASGEQMRALVNGWKLYRARSALRERNPIAQIMGAFRQRERSDTIKAVTMLRKDKGGRYVVAIGFMGTGSRFYDWFSNFRMATEEGFHKGFSQLAAYFEESAERILFPDTAAELGLEKLTLADILKEMKSAQSRFFLWMAGHSQGAAVMQVFCHRLIGDWGVLPQNMVGYGFASPTVGTGQFVYDPARYPLYHVLNSDDLVPRMGALLHLGLCLEYQAGEGIRQAVYAMTAAGGAREAMEPFVTRIKDSLAFLEHCAAFCSCILEEKGEDGLAALMEKRWVIAPFDKALSYVGEKAQDLIRAVIRHAHNAYASLAGQSMDEGRLAELKESMCPIIKRFTVRQLFAGISELLIPPHQIMRDHFKRTGAYSYIVLRGWKALRPFIWTEPRHSLPERAFADAIDWQEGAPAPGGTAFTAPRRASRPRSPSKSVRARGIGARKAGKKERRVRG